MDVRKIWLTALMMLVTFPVWAQSPYMDEVKALGAVSGQGLACGASRYDAFELLARAILLTKSPSDKLQSDAIYAYSEEKANAYFSKQMDGFFECKAINRRFDNQDIFKAVLYADGTLKMPDGQVFTPRQPYDATMIYKKDTKIRENLQAIYDGSGNHQLTRVNVKDSTLPQGSVAPVYQPQAHTENVPAVSSMKRISRESRPLVNADAGIGHLRRR